MTSEEELTDPCQRVMSNASPHLRCESAVMSLKVKKGPGYRGSALGNAKYPAYNAVVMFYF